jgi:dimethylamine monooxygenase subunit A
MLANLRPRDPSGKDGVSLPAGEAPDAAPAYVPVDGRPWRLTMGLRPLDPARWLEVDGARRHELFDKAGLLGTVRDRVVAVLPGSEAAGAELLAAVLDYLDTHHPGTVAPGLGATVVERSTGVVVDTTSLHPLDAAARLVQEDLCLMERRGRSWVLTAASVCFPSRWDLRAKVGRDLATIHQPVPGYQEAIGAPVEAFFDRLTVERPMWRLNWTLIDRPDLHQPDPSGRRRPAVGAQPGRELWFRVERQTLRRLTERPAITFTIRTYVTALGDLVAAHPGVVESLRATLPTVPPATVAYKGWAGMVGPLRDWLDAVADVAPPATPG